MSEAAVRFRLTSLSGTAPTHEGVMFMTETIAHPFETGLDRTPANYVPLTPVSFLTRAASAFGNKTAVMDGTRRYTYRQLLDRCVRLASGLAGLGVGRLDTVAIMASNIPEMIEAHYAVPMLNPLNPSCPALLSASRLRQVVSAVEARSMRS
jgi:acyl-CoA synthetase (AMP-forming)/AMP-acid ligase II